MLNDISHSDNSHHLGLKLKSYLCYKFKILGFVPNSQCLFYLDRFAKFLWQVFPQVFCEFDSFNEIKYLLWKKNPCEPTLRRIRISCIIVESCYLPKFPKIIELTHSEYGNETEEENEFHSVHENMLEIKY